MQQSHTFASPTSQHTSQSLQKSVPAQPHRQSITDDKQTMTERRAACNSTYPNVVQKALKTARFYCLYAIMGSLLFLSFIVSEQCFFELTHIVNY